MPALPRRQAAPQAIFSGLRCLLFLQLFLPLAKVIIKQEPGELPQQAAVPAAGTAAQPSVQQYVTVKGSHMLALSPQKPVVSAGEGTVQSKVWGTWASLLWWELSCGVTATLGASPRGAGSLLPRSQVATPWLAGFLCAEGLVSCFRVVLGKGAG